MKSSRSSTSTSPRPNAEVFEAQIFLDEEKFEDADAMAYKSMLSAAKALVKTQFRDVTEDPNHIVTEFRKRFYDTELFFDKYAKGKFAHYLFDRHEREDGTDRDKARRLTEEAQLFIEASHGCQTRMQDEITAGATA